MGKPVVIVLQVVMIAVVGLSIGGLCETYRSEANAQNVLLEVPTAVRYIRQGLATPIEGNSPGIVPDVSPWQQWADEHPVEDPPEAAIVTRDGHMIAVHPGFAAGYDSVMWQESRYDCSNSNWITINGVAYEQLGCMQLLWDAAIRARAASFGFARSDMLDESANLIVANSWFSDTEDWRRWATKPQWLAIKEGEHE